MDPNPVAEQIVELLAPYLGPFNAKVAVRTAAKKSLGLTPDQLSRGHLEELTDSLRPMLCTLAGRGAAERVLERIRSEVS